MENPLPVPQYQGLDVTQLLKKYLEKDPLESAFNWGVKQILIPEPPKPPSLLDALHQLFKGTNHDQWGLYISKMVEYMLVQSNPHRVKSLCNIFTTLVSQSVIPPRLVCESIIKQLDINNQLTWINGMSLVRNIVGGVDYKGCREIMKLVLDRFDQLPRNIPEKDINALHSGRELMGYILERNASLLPAYIAYDEIKLRYQNRDMQPHWALKDITATLNGSMEILSNIISGRMLPHLSPVICVSLLTSSAWKLETSKYSFSLQGRLPYNQDLLLPQTNYMNKIIIQPNSKEFVHSILGGINKQNQSQPNAFIQQCMLRLILDALAKTNDWSTSVDMILSTWHHLASQVLLFSAHHIINVNTLLDSIGNSVRDIKCNNSRNYLMWLLQYYVSMVGVNTLKEDLHTVLELVKACYTGTEPLPLPDPSVPQCVLELSAAGLILLLKKKAQAAIIPFTSEIPTALSDHIDFLQEQFSGLSKAPPTIPSWYMLTALLNACSFGNTTDDFNNTLNGLINTSFAPKPRKTPSPNKDEGSGDIEAPSAPSSVPLPMNCVGLMVMHVKARLSDKIKIMITDVVKQPQSGSSPTPMVDHALLETFTRVLLWCGTKSFQSQLIPSVFKLQSWGMLHSLLEVISYRIHTQLSMHFRFSILQLLHSIAGVSIIPTQLFICAENTALHLIQGLNGFELPLQLAKNMPDPKQLFHADSEELNKVLLLVLAQSLHFSRVELGGWLENLLKELEVNHSRSLFLWPETALPYLPPPIKQHCTFNTQTYPVTMETRKKLINRVQEEYQNLQTKTEQELHACYNETDSGQYILCIIWKQLVDNNQITPQVSRILQRLRLSPKKLAILSRLMIDYIIYTCPQPGAPSNPKFVSVVTHLNDLTWKYFFCPLDRLLLCILWRNYGGQEAILSMQLVYQLLMREDVVSRVNDFVQTVPSEVWEAQDWGSSHSKYHSLHTECFQLDTTGTGTLTSSMPMFFGNVCLRLLPVIDLTLQRLLEKPETYSQLITKLLDKYKPIYKYHQYPVWFLLSLLHYYNSSLSKPANNSLRKLLANSILSGLSQKSLTTYFTQSFNEFLLSADSNWTTPTSYWTNLLERISQSFESFIDQSPPIAWPLSEFSSYISCRLYCTCVEVMSLPLDTGTVAKGLINAIVELSSNSDSDQHVMEVLNGAGALFTTLPDVYSECIYAELVVLFKTPPLSSPPTDKSISCSTLFANSTKLGCMMNLFHAFLHHASVSVVSGFTMWLKTQLKPVTNNELQLLYLCHLIGPLMNRLASDKPSLLLELVMELYHFIQKVDQAQEGMIANCDPICDLLYHIKYKHIGDLKKEEIEKIVTSLHPQLRMRLRFLVHTLTGSHGNDSSSTPSGGVGGDQHSAAVVTPTSFSGSVSSAATTESMEVS